MHPCSPVHCIDVGIKNPEHQGELFAPLIHGSTYPLFYSLILNINNGLPEKGPFTILELHY